MTSLYPWSPINIEQRPLRGEEGVSVVFGCAIHPADASDRLARCEMFIRWLIEARIMTLREDERLL